MLGEGVVIRTYWIVIDQVKSEGVERSWRLLDAVDVSSGTAGGMLYRISCP